MANLDWTEITRIALEARQQDEEYGTERMEQTHCPHGHELTRDNIKHETRPNGKVSRRCLECYRRSKRGSKGHRG